MKNGIYNIKEYHRIMLNKYDDDCKKWDYTQGGFPMIAFYMFFTEQGYERETGFVLVKDRSHYWFKTKKEAIKK